MRQSVVATGLLLMASCAAWSQPSKSKLSFEVASLKPAAPSPGDRIMRRLAGGPGSTDPGTLNYSNVTLRILITNAYNLKDYQLEGPEWIDSLGFDLIAKLPPGTTTQDEVAQMMQTLLAERFNLVFHRETKQLPVYALVVAKGGPKLKEVDPAAAPQPLPAPPKGAPGPGPEGGMKPGGMRMMMTPDGIRLNGSITMAQLANALTRQMGRAVLDQTELNKTYDVDISWMPDEMDRGPADAPRHMAGGPGGNPPEGPHSSEPKPTLAQALQEKLGLRLDPRKSTADVLIVDRADKVPVEN